MAFNIREQINVHPAPKKDEKKSELGKAFTETLATFLGCFAAILMAIGFVSLVQALCRCR